MKLIIDIDEETYKNVINTVSISFGKGMDNETISDITSLCRAVKLSRVYEERPHIIDNCDMNVFEPEKYMKEGEDHAVD